MVGRCATVVVLLIFCVEAFAENSRFNATKKDSRTRNEKLFSLFSVVQFPNDACRSTSSTFSNGTCLTSGECSARGGSATGNCAAGFGVCCVFSVSDTSSTINQNNSYIVNPSYPSNYAPTSTPNTVTYTIQKCSCDICRIRLDYETFTLDSPIASTGTAATSGQCTTDRMTIATTSDTTVPTVGTTTIYGRYPYICGTNTGYHSYIDMSCTCTDEATLSFVLGSTTTNNWKIKVTQFGCSDPAVASQQGCFQYHTGVTGTLQSYNYAGGNMLATQHYTNCIRAEEGYCCIKYTPVFWNLPSSADCPADADGAARCCNPAAANAVAQGNANRCAGADACTHDYVIIPQALEDTVGTSATPVNYDRFCGACLTVTGTLATQPVGAAPGATCVGTPVISCLKPFIVEHVTGIVATNGNAANQNVGAVGAAAGFQLTYSQIPGTC